MALNKSPFSIIVIVISLQRSVLMGNLYNYEKCNGAEMAAGQVERARRGDRVVSSTNFLDLKLMVQVFKKLTCADLQVVIVGFIELTYLRFLHCIAQCW